VQSRSQFDLLNLRNLQQGKKAEAFGNAERSELRISIRRDYSCDWPFVGVSGESWINDRRNKKRVFAE